MKPISIHTVRVRRAPDGGAWASVPDLREVVRVWARNKRSGKFMRAAIRGWADSIPKKGRRP